MPCNLWVCGLAIIAIAVVVHSILNSGKTLETKKQGLGFKELSPGENVTVDIVAIHGLDGHRENSWTSDTGTMWLRDLLPLDLPNARILTYGYNADTRGFTQTSTHNIFRHAEAFVGELSQLRSADPERPIIFIAHSLGGIILKRALAICHATGFSHRSRYRDIKVSTFAVLFFGTPHSGANGVELADWIRRLSSIYMYTSGTLLNDLHRDSPELESLQQMYLHASEDIETIFFYEEYRTPIYGGFSEMIVPRHLATISGDRNAETVSLHADHVQLVKFDGEDDSNYIRVARYIAKYVGEATGKVKKNWIKEEGHRIVDKGEEHRPHRTIFPKPRPPVSRNYVGRPRIHNVLTEKLLPSKAPERQPRCILHGLGGSGKTQLASSWIEMNKQRFQKIIFIDASSQQQIEADLETAIRSEGVDYSRSTWDDAVAYLSGRRDWILFFDNANEPGIHLEQYFPNTPYGVIIITTRNQYSRGYAPDCEIQVGKLEEPEALEMLHSVAGIFPPSNDSSIAIVNELGLLALPITQAGARISQTRQFDTYLTAFRKHRDKIMRDDSINDKNYNGSTYTAFEMSFDVLPQRSRDFMKVCAYLHHSLIPQALFEESIGARFQSSFDIKDYPPLTDKETIISDLEGIFGSEWDDYLFQETIGPILQGSLIDIVADDQGHFFYNLHPLVQTYIRDLNMRVDSKRYAILASQLLVGGIRPISDEKIRARHRQLSPHIESLPWEIKQVHVSYALAFDSVYHSVGNWQACEKLRRYCYLRLAEVLGPRHLDTISAMNNLSTTLGYLGQIDEPDKIQQEVLRLRKELLGLRHHDTISAMHDRSIILRGRGQLKEAEKMMQEVLVLQEEILGPRHPDTISTMHNLAAAFHDRGQRKKAEKIVREGLALRLEILGPRHPDTIQSMYSLSYAAGNRGKLEEAEKIMREVLTLRKEVLGPRHPDTIAAMNSLAGAFGERGKLEDAEKMVREVLALFQEMFGPRHPATLWTMESLGFILHSSGQLEEAEKIKREVLMLLKDILGPRHIRTSRAMTSLALTIGNLGQLEEGKELQQEAFLIQKEVLGLWNMDTIFVMSELYLFILHFRRPIGVLRRLSGTRLFVLKTRSFYLKYSLYNSLFLILACSIVALAIILLVIVFVAVVVSELWTWGRGLFSSKHVVE